MLLHLDELKSKIREIICLDILDVTAKTCVMPANNAQRKLQNISYVGRYNQKQFKTNDNYHENHQKRHDPKHEYYVSNLLGQQYPNYNNSHYLFVNK